MCSTAIVPYAGLGLDRAADRRDDPAWIAAMRADRRARVWPLWRDQCLLAGDPPAPLAIPVGPDADQARLVLLGLHEGIPYFTVDLSDLPLAEALASVAADTAADIRSLFAGLRSRPAVLGPSPPGSRRRSQKIIPAVRLKKIFYTERRW